MFKELDLNKYGCEPVLFPHGLQCYSSRPATCNKMFYALKVYNVFTCFKNRLGDTLKPLKVLLSILQSNLGGMYL